MVRALFLPEGFALVASKRAPADIGPVRRPVRCRDLVRVRETASQALISAYLERREVLLRFLVVRTGSSAMAEDLIQDVFLRIQALSEDEAAEVRNPQAFLYRLASNLFLDRLKQDQRRGRRDDEWRRSQSGEIGGEDTADAPSAEDATWARLKLERIIAALDGLAPNCRQAFRLHKLESRSHAETAQTMGLSRSAVEKYVSAALKHLLKEVGWP